MLTMTTWSSPQSSALVGLLNAVDLAEATLPCQENNPDLWFADAPADLEQAKALCFGCPLRSRCLAGALSRHEPWGVWGGEIFERGSVVSHKRSRGRPRGSGYSSPTLQEIAA